MKEKETEGITLHDFFHTLIKGWKVILVIFVLVSAVGSVYTFKIKKNTYYSLGSITVEYNGNRQDNTVDITSSLHYVTTVCELMKSEDVLKKVADNLKDEYKLNVEDLKKTISISSSTTSMLITFKATSDNGEKSQKIVRTLANEISKYSFDSTSDYDKLYCKISVRDNGFDYYKAGPNRALLLAGFMLGGLVLGCCVVLIIEYTSLKFRNKDELRQLDYPIIGTIFKLKKKTNLDNDDLIEPTLRNFEPYNRLLSNIQLANVDNPLKVIMFTSAIQSEFKTTTIANTAYAAANNSKKVVVIDLDVRKSRLHKVFGLPKNNGLVEYLNDEITFDEVIKHTAIGVDVITSGKNIDNPVVILESEKLKNLINKLKDIYDLVLIDTAPFMACNDSLEIAKLVEGCVFNVAINTSLKKDVIYATSQISQLTKVIGINCTNVPTTKSDGYYYYYGKEEKQK